VFGLTSVDGWRIDGLMTTVCSPTVGAPTNMQDVWTQTEEGSVRLGTRPPLPRPQQANTPPVRRVVPLWHVRRRQGCLAAAPVVVDDGGHERGETLL
jgi:hypothetical protein